MVNVVLPHPEFVAPISHWGIIMYENIGGKPYVLTRLFDKKNMNLAY